MDEESLRQFYQAWFVLKARLSIDLSRFTKERQRRHLSFGAESSQAAGRKTYMKTNESVPWITDRGLGTSSTKLR